MVSYQITVTNDAAATLSNIDVKDILPAGLQFTAAGSTAGWVNTAPNEYTFPIATLGVNQSIVLDLVAKVIGQNQGNCFEQFINEAEATVNFNGQVYSVNENEVSYQLPDAIQSKIPTTSTTTLGIGTLSGFHFLEGDLTVDNNFTFINCQLIVAPGKEIQVGDGVNAYTLDLENTQIWGCYKMWKGILVKEGSVLNTRNNTELRDAFHAIEPELSTLINLKDVLFFNNFVGLYIPAYGGSGTISNISVLFGGNIAFDCSPGNLLSEYDGMPYQVSSRGFAGIDASRLYLNISSPAVCEFKNLNIGIRLRSSSAFLNKVHFEDIAIQQLPGTGSGANPVTPEDGTGVVSFDGDLTAIGNNIAGPPNPNIDFENCYRGIISVNTTNKLIDLKMEVLWEGVRSTPYKFKPTLIDHNRITTKRDGIVFSQSELSSSMIVRNTHIILSAIGNDVSSGVGIQVQENQQAVNNVWIYANNVALFRPAIGIWVNNSLGTRVLGNSVFIDGSVNGFTPGGTFCYWVTSSSSSLIKCNFATGQSIAQTNTVQNAGFEHFGYRMEDSPNNLYGCNFAFGFQFGFFFQGNCISNEMFYRNKMNTCFEGLHITMTGALGVQSNDPGAISPIPNQYRRNEWQPNTFGNFGFNCQNPIGTLFWVNEILPPCGSTDIYLPSFSPFPIGIMNSACVYLYSDQECPINANPLWDSLEYPPSWDSLPNVGICGEEGNPTILGEFRSSLDSTIARGSYISGEFEVPILWEARRELYARLENHPEWLSDSTLAAFYAQTQDSSIAGFNVLYHSERQMHALNPAILSLLQSLRVDLSESLTDLRETDSLLTIPQADSLMLIQERSNLIEEADSLQQVYHQTVSGAYSGNIAYADSLAIINNVANYTELYEINHQTLHQIYLETYGKGIYSFSETQMNTLYDIAQQCPHTGGKAVFWARSLYADAGGKSMYDDTGSCLSVGVNYRQGQAIQNIPSGQIKLYPNPAKNTITIESGYQGEAKLLLYNNFGQEVYNAEFTMNESVYLGNLGTGIYFYQILKNSAYLQGGKLLIQK
ncbi:MAG: DUF11 domain-containing protein [Bacteroidia bacterium]|nr:DUF11 domain-containing protein [Bacteroidia bacterium]